MKPIGATACTHRPMSLYTHVLKDQESKAVDALPDLSVPGSQPMRKTGTDDVGSDSQVLGGQTRTPANSGGQLPLKRKPKPPFSEHK